VRCERPHYSRLSDVSLTTFLFAQFSCVNDSDNGCQTQGVFLSAARDAFEHGQVEGLADGHQDEMIRLPSILMQLLIWQATGAVPRVGIRLPPPTSLRYSAFFREMRENPPCSGDMSY
jgi:hypothetical protein